MGGSDTVYLSEDELAAWQQEVASVKPLTSGERVDQPIAAKARAKTQAAMIRPPKPKRTSSLFHLVAGEFRGVDKATVRKLRRGQITINRSIDLHGFRQEEAQTALQRQLMEAVIYGDKVVLVITGKGRAGDSVLKQRLPDWLNDDAIRPYLLAFDVARPQDGGSGAFYVLLKKVKVLSDETDFGDR